MKDYMPIARDLARWLQTRPGVSDVRPPIMSPVIPSRSRLPIPLPMPSFLAPNRSPSFDLHFTFKGRPRVFRYFIEGTTDPEEVRDVLRVHTNGELMVRVPDDFGSLMPNEIYYSNRSGTLVGALGTEGVDSR